MDLLALRAKSSIGGFISGQDFSIVKISSHREAFRRSIGRGGSYSALKSIGGEFTHISRLGPLLLLTLRFKVDMC